MPDQKITDLVDGTPLQPTDEFVVARAGDNFKIDGADIVSAATAAVTKHDVTLSGNTAGVLALVSSGTLSLAGGNNITLSQVGNAVTISGANVGGAQTGISGISASDTLYTSGTVRITGVGGGVTVSTNTGQRIDISVAAPVAQTVQTQNVVDVTLSGNTAGALALVSSGTLTLAGGNNITLSQVGNAVTISGPNVGGAQTGISGIANSQTTYTSGTVSLSELGALTIRSSVGQIYQLEVPATSSLSATGAVSISVNGSTISIGAATQSVQPETQTFIAGISASNTLYTSGNVRISGSQAVTVRSGTGQLVIIDVPAQSTQVETQTFIAGVSASDTLYTSGNVRITGVGGGITVSSNTGQRIDLSVAAQSVQPETQTFIAGVSASDTLYTSGNVRITGVGGGVTVSSNTGQRVDISVAAPVAQTNQAGSVYAISNTSGTSSGTYDARTLSIAGAGIVTVAASNSGWRINASQSVQTQSLIQALYDGANSITTGTVRVTDANGVTFSINAQTLSASVNQSISMFAVSNTTQSTSGTAHKSALSFGGAGVASVGVTGGSVVISVPAGGGAGFSAGVSTGGNTAGATGISGTQLVLVGNNNISLSQTTGANGATVSINGDDAFSFGVSTGGNTAGATGVTGTQMVLVGVSPVSLSQTTGAAGGTISINAPATSSLSATGAVEISSNGSTISIGAPSLKTMADIQNFPLALAQLMTHAASISKTPFYFPMSVPGRITMNSFVIRLSAVTTATLQSFSVHAGIYTAVNSTSMALMGSWSESYVASTASSASWSGVRNYVMTGQGTIPAISILNGGDYFIGMMFSAGAAGSLAQSIMGAGSLNPSLGRIIPGVNAQSTGTSQGAMPMHGRGSTTVNALPANVVASELVNQGAGASMQLHPWIYIRS